ncbi:MAG: hypothetical protein ACRELY_31455 [Polyangiaceae bacterium]
MKRFLITFTVFVGMPMLAAVGCNAILGNEPGRLSQDAAISTCPADQKSCGPVCAPLDDPKLGCAGDCTVCPTPINAQSACVPVNGVYNCGLGDCNSQFGDCDNNVATGCETHTTVRANCGSCGNDCKQDYCERQGTGYICSATCDSPNTLCPPDAGPTEQECIDTTTDIANCGGCGVNCAVPNGVGDCAGGSCKITCDPNYFLCGGACVLPSQSQCGSSCTPCTPPNTCDTTAGSDSYGTCVSPADAGTECTTHLCGSACCANDTDVCCPSTFTLCTPETDTACGPSCDVCNTATGSTCTGHACVCTAGFDRTCRLGSQYWCCLFADSCDQITAGQCDAPDAGGADAGGGDAGGGDAGGGDAGGGDAGTGLGGPCTLTSQCIPSLCCCSAGSTCEMFQTNLQDGGTTCAVTGSCGP